MVLAASDCAIQLLQMELTEQTFSTPSVSNSASPCGPQLSMTISPNSYSFLPLGCLGYSAKVCFMEVMITTL